VSGGKVFTKKVDLEKAEVNRKVATSHRYLMVSTHHLVLLGKWKMKYMMLRWAGNIARKDVM
jgi:hypothetical protein